MIRLILQPSENLPAIKAVLTSLRSHVKEPSIASQARNDYAQWQLR